MKKLCAAFLCCVILCTAFASCTKIPRLEEGTVRAQTVLETTTDTAQANTKSEPSTDADGFPNEPEDGHTKRY